MQLDFSFKKKMQLDFICDIAWNICTNVVDYIESTKYSLLCYS